MTQPERPGDPSEHRDRLDGRAWTRRALDLRAAGHVEEALDAIERAQQAFVREGGAEAATLADRLAAQLLDALGRPDEAAEHLLRARRALEVSGAPPADLASCDEHLGRTLLRAGRALDATHHLSLAAREHGAAGARVATARCSHDAAVAAATGGRHVQAEQVLAELRTRFLARRRRRETATCSANLGIVLSRLGRHDEAVHRLQEARAIFEAIDRPADVAACDTYLGGVLFDAGRPLEAAGRLDDAAAGWEDLGRRTAAGRALWDAAEALDAAGHAPDADHRRSRAAELGVGPPPS